jgi:tetratricopeptide (TPR) repeat protein
MGAVYVAHDPVLGRLVAIKLFQADLELADADTRFAREARAAAALNHANIVTVHDFGNHDAQPFIVMEYIQGETLSSIIRNKAPIAAIEKLTWLEQLCAGAAYAHNLGVIHRDIKPSNLIIDRSRRLKILDFGIAKLLGAVASNATTLVGTPGYMAPEQILGEPIDHRADVFSIGVVAYELFSGSEAFPGDSVPAITHRILTQDPKPLSDLCPDLPDSVVEIVDRAMSKKADARFENADALRTALLGVRAHVDGMETIMPTIVRPTPPPRARPGTGGRPATGTVRTTPAPLTPTRGEPTRADRQRIEQLRAEQVASSLTDARTALAAGELDRAQNACLQALVLKPDDPEALSLEEQIQGAQALARATELVDEARDELGRGGLTGAFDLLEQARTLAPDFTELKVLERDLRLARADQDRLRRKTESVQLALDASARALADGDVDAALAYARQARDLQPDSVPAREAEAAALLRLDEETGANAAAGRVAISAPTVIAPAGRRSPLSSPSTPVSAPDPAPAEAAPTVILPPAAHPAAVAKSAPTVAAPVTPAKPAKTGTSAKPAKAAVAATAWNARLAAAWTATPAPQKRMAAIGSGVLLAVLAAGAFVLLSPGASATGSVVLDAIPYAVVSSVENAAGGERPALPPDASTPLVLNLPVGTYRVRLTGPPPASESRLITVTVNRDATTTATVETFTMLTPEEYFEPYLSTGNSAAAESDAAPDSTPDAAAPGSTTAPANAPATGLAQ